MSTGSSVKRKRYRVKKNSSFSKEEKWTWSDYRRAFRKGMRVVEAGLHLWMVIKKRNFLTIGTAITSAYEAAETLLETNTRAEAEKSIDDHLKEMGAKEYFSSMRRFIYSSLVTCDIPCERFFPPGTDI